jgi:hypothetical protein
MMSTQNTGKTHSNVLTEGRSRAAAALLLCIVGALLLVVAPRLSAQATPSHIPTQIASARTVFLSNNLGAPLADTDKIFNEIYAGVQQLNRFSIVTDPQTADLLMQFNLVNTDNIRFGTVQTITLQIIDPKTQVILWSVSDSGQTKAIYSSQDRNLIKYDVVDSVLAYLKIISGPQPTTSH